MKMAVRIPAIRAAVLIVSLPHFAFLFPFVTRARDLPLDVAIPENNSMNRSFFALTTLVLLSSACSNEKPASAAQPHQKREGDVAPRAAVVTAPTQPYRAISVASGGKITGVV